jgi:hypothetical protein
MLLALVIEVEICGDLKTLPSEGVSGILNSAWTAFAAPVGYTG